MGRRDTSRGTKRVMYWCIKCGKKHREKSGIGKKHLKYKGEQVITNCENCGKGIPNWIDVCWHCGVYRNMRVKKLLEDIDEKMVETTDLQDQIMNQLRKSRRIGTTKLAEKLDRSKSGLLRSLEGLRKKGLIEYTEGKKDKIWTTT